MPSTSLPVSDLIALTGSHFPELAGPDVEVAPILKGGSDRRYYRLKKRGRPVQMILVTYTEARPDNACFFPATEILTRHGVRVPKVYVHDATRRLAWIEDLGALDLWAFQDSPWTERQRLYERTLAEVAKVHRLNPSDLPPDVLATLMPPFDESLYLWEQNYFFDHFASHFSSATHEEIDAVRHGSGCAALRAELGALPRAFVHRDFQSQNVIIRDGDPFLIDYQGLRPGRPEYDIASLLFDPYVKFTAEERDSLWRYYRSLRENDAGWHTSDRLYAQCACQRLMQALGAYGNLSLNLGRPEFANHIAPAVENLRQVIQRHGVLLDLLPVLQIREDAVG